MEIPIALRNLAESLKYSQPPYNLLLTSTISLTPEVLKEICGSEQWDMFSTHLRRSPYNHRINLLKRHLSGYNNLDGYQSLIRLIEKGYFSTVLTTNLDSTLEDILSKSSSTYRELVVGRDKNEHVANALDIRNDGVLIIKLHGNLRDGILSETYPDFIEMKENIIRGLTRSINQDIVIIGSIEREDDIVRLLNISKGSIYYALPETLQPNDTVTRIIRARGYVPNDFIINGYFGRFETFCKTLESLLVSNTPPITHEISPVRNQPVKPFELAPSKILSVPPEPRQSLPPNRPLARSEEQNHAPQRPKRFPLIRWIILIIGLLLIAAGTTLMILSFRNVIDSSWSINLGIIFTALGLALTLYFGIFPLSPANQPEIEPSEQSPAPSGDQSLSLKQAQQVQQNQQAQQAQQILHVGHLQQNFYSHGEPVAQPSTTHEPSSPLPGPVQGPPSPVAQPSTAHEPSSSPGSMAQTQLAWIKETTVPADPKMRIEESILELSAKSQNDKIKLTNQLYKQIWDARRDVIYASSIFDKGKTVSDQQYNRLDRFLSVLNKPSSDLLQTIELLPEKILPWRFPLRDALYKVVAVIDELRLLIFRPNRAVLSQEIQQKFQLLSGNIDEVTLAFSELCIRFQDDTWPTG